MKTYTYKVTVTAPNRYFPPESDNLIPVTKKMVTSYVKDAIGSWSGQFHPDDWARSNEFSVEVTSLKD